MQEGYVSVNENNGISTITFFHPKSNSLPGSILSELAQGIMDAGADDNTRVIVLRSEGEKAFCAGASFDELITIDNFEQGHHFFMGFAKVINAARKCPKLIIARVQGRAVGGGVGMAAAADYCMAGGDAYVKLSELNIGIGPFVVGPAVERKVGLSAMSHLAINASEWLSPEWAREKGLFTEVYDSIAELDEGVRNLAFKLSQSSPEAAMELKKILWQGTDHWDRFLSERAAISGRLVLSDFTRKAIEEFKQK